MRKRKDISTRMRFGNAMAEFVDLTEHIVCRIGGEDAKRGVMTIRDCAAEVRGLWMGEEARVLAVVRR